MNKLFESVDNLFDSGKSLINEDYRDDVINDLGIEPGSDEEAQVDEILNTVPTVYDVFTLSQVDVNEYKSDLYTTVEDEDQAYDIVAELGAQGINAFVESRDANEDVIVPNTFLSGLYARDLNESTEGLSKEDKICRLEDKIKECKDRIEEIGNTEFFDDGSYEAGLELEDRAMERASLEYAISEYQKEIDELKGETINEGSKYDLYSIRGEIRDDETGRLMLHTKNKNNGLVGCANFFGDGSDMVTVYEGNGDGSDDKSMGFDEFLANYDYVLADEDEQPFGVTEASKPLVKDKFYIDGVGPEFDGYHDPSVLWNGWECPFFTKEVADEITKTFTDESVTFEYDEAGKKYIITWNGEDTEEVPMTRRETVDGELDLFPLGYYGWCWNKASDDLEESNKLDETAWKGTLKSGSALRALINNPDDTIEYYQAVLDKIKDVCNEAIPMCDDEYYANGFQSVIDDIECIYYDEELDEGNVDYILDGLWDWADGAKLFVALGESEVVEEASSVDGLVTKFVELPYGDFKANNAIGILNDGTVFWVDSENEAYSVPCSYDELKRAMYDKEQDDWMEFSQSFTRIEDPLETKIMVAIGRYSEDVLDYHETFKDGLPF